MEASLPPGAVRIRSLAMAMSTSTAGVLPAFLTGALGVRIGRDLGVDEATLGAELAIYFLLGGLMAVPGGRFADRYGWRRLATVAAVLSATGLSLGAVSTQWWMLGIALMFGGTGMGLAGPASNLVLADELPIERLGFSFGVKQASVPIATFLAGLSVPALAITLGWRAAFLAALVSPLVVIVLTRTFPGATTGLPRHDRPSFSVDGTLVLLAATGGLGMVATGALGAFLVPSLIEAGISEGAAGLLYSGASLLGLAVRVTAGWWADRRGSEGLRPASALLGLGALGFTLLAARVSPALITGTFLAYGAGWGWSGLFLFAVVRRYPGRAAAATGTVQLGLALGAAGGPLLFGAVANRTGHQVAWLVIAISTILSSCLALTGALRARAPEAPSRVFR